MNGVYPWRGIASDQRVVSCSGQEPRMNTNYRKYGFRAHDLRAWKIAELSSVSRPTINQLFMRLRIRIAQVCNASSPLSGEVEVDESYFGARRVCGKRGAEQAVNRSSSESWNATGKCRKSSLTPPGSSYRARSGVKWPWKHHPLGRLERLQWAGGHGLQKAFPGASW